MKRDKVTSGMFALWDALLINVAFVLSYIVRYQLELPYPVDERFYAPFTPYIPFAALLTGLSLLMFRINGLYNPRNRNRRLHQIYSIIKAHSPGDPG